MLRYEAGPYGFIGPRAEYLEQRYQKTLLEKKINISRFGWYELNVVSARFELYNNMPSIKAFTIEEAYSGQLHGGRSLPEAEAKPVSVRSKRSREDPSSQNTKR